MGQRARWLVAITVLLVPILVGVIFFRAPPATPNSVAATPAATPPDNGTALAADQGALADTPVDGDLAELVAAGHRQLARNSLSRPPGGNAIETWLTAFAREPLHPEVQAGLRATLARLGEQVARYVAAGNDAEARRLHGLARDFAVRAGLTTEDAWRGFKQQVRDSLLDALAASVGARDARRGEALAELARALDPGHPDLQPWLDRSARLPRPGDVIAGDDRPWVFFSPAEGERPALAVMAREVTRGEYAAFAEASGREAARCAGRFWLLRLFERRDWRSPGFDQDNRHPAVCVSWEDADAYARWLGERSGLRLRLPEAAEWRRYAGRGNGNGGGAPGCEITGRGCDGTRPADGLRPGALGLRGVHGNAAEWLADCAGDCDEHLVAGASWRDDAGHERVPPPRPARGERGYDDVGFRLVRELSADDVPQPQSP